MLVVARHQVGVAVAVQIDQQRDFGSAEEIIATARSRTVLPIEPRILLEGGTARVVMPGDPDD